MVERFITPGDLPTPYERELLVILMEECAEVAQRASKCIRFGINEVQPGQGLTNAQRLAGEMGDLTAVVDRLVNMSILSADEINDAAELKQKKLNIFMQSEKP